jgi:hypothetical protein
MNTHFVPADQRGLPHTHIQADSGLKPTELQFCAAAVLALGLRLAAAAPAGTRPAHLLEPYAFRRHHVEGLAPFLTDQQIVIPLAGHSADHPPCLLPGSQLTVRYAASLERVQSTLGARDPCSGCGE